MPEYLSPGVYVEEIESGSQPIEGVSTSTAGFVGMTVRGPSTGPPLLVTSFPDFTRQFGGYLPNTLGNSWYLAYAVKGFFDNLGQRVYITRVKGTGALAATSSGLVGGLITRLTNDALTNATTVQLASLRGVHAGTVLTLTQVKDGITTTKAVTVTSYDDAAGTASFAVSDKLPSDFQARYTTVATDVTNPTTTVAFAAHDEGLWGSSLSVQIYPSSRAQAQVVQLVPTALDTVQLSSTANFYVGAIVEFNRGTKAAPAAQKVYGKIIKISGSSIQLKTAFASATDLDPNAPATVTTARTCEFDVVASYGGVNESFRMLTLDDTTPYYYKTNINASSTLLKVTSGADDTREDPFTMPSGHDGLNVTMAGGSDGTEPPDADFVGQDNGPGNRTGIQALIDIDEISIVAVPGKVSQTIQNALITHCETLKYRFAILDPKPKSNNQPADMNDIQSQRNLYDTKYAAIYYPRVVIADPVTGDTIPVPPSGHMAGIYARVDNERGVHKAPANEVIGSIIDLELKINKGEQDILNPEPRNINVLRNFESSGRGLRVWGARCITSDALWKYINVRRLFIFLEASLDQGTQWAVFEPNDEPLWARLRQSVTNFLTRVWHDGALQGAKAEEAFFVKCDRTTMTQDDIDNGRLIMLIGVAPVKPAEFVIIRIGQWDGGSSVQEL
jgi:Bacteriophage tail sheath protein